MHSAFDAWNSAVWKQERTIKEFVRKTEEDMVHRVFLAWKATLPAWLNQHAEVDAFIHQVASLPRGNARTLNGRHHSTE
jgi:hypothetical protein